MMVENVNNALKMDYVLNARRKDISEEIDHLKKTKIKHQLLLSH